MDRKKRNLWTLVIGGIFLALMVSIFILWFILSRTNSDPLISKFNIESDDLNFNIPETVSNSEVKLQFDRISQLIDKEGGQLLAENLIDLDVMISIKKQLEISKDKMLEGQNRMAYLGMLTVEKYIDDQLKQKLLRDEAFQFGQELENAILSVSDSSRDNPALNQAFASKDRGDDRIKSKEYPLATEDYLAGLEFVKQAKKWNEDLLKKKIDAVEKEIADLNLDRANELLMDAKKRFPEDERLKQLSIDLESIIPFFEQLKRVDQLVLDGEHLSALDSLDTLIKRSPENEYLRKRHQAIKDLVIKTQVIPLTKGAKELFDQGDYLGSLEKLEQASKIVPEDQSIKDSIQNVKEAQSLKGIRLKLVKAYEYFKEYRWRNAKELYEEILKIEPTNQEAMKGALESARRYAEKLKYQSHIKAAQIYYQQGRFPKAIEEFNKGLDIKPDYLFLTPYEEQIKRKLEDQKIPVKVKILSNNKTWVSILGVLAPEKFKEKEIELYPDVYHLRGKRTGYPDFSLAYRLERLENTGEPLVLVIECKH